MPAPVVAVGDIILGVVKGTLFGQETQTTFHWRVTATDGGSTISTIAQDIVDDIIADMALICSQDWVAHTGYARRLMPAPTRGFEVSAGLVPGAVPADSLPPSVAAVLSRYTNNPGPGGRGRIFLPAVPVTFHEDGRINVIGMTAYQGFVPRLDVAWSTGSGMELEPVLWKGQPAPPLIESALVRPILRSQRRREIGVGI